MRKHTIIPFVMIFVLAVAMAAAVISARRKSVILDRATSVNRFIMEDGAIAEMFNTGDDTVHLRKIARDGEVLSYTRLKKSYNNGTSPTYIAIGLAGDELYLHYNGPDESAGNIYKFTIIAYDMNSGKQTFKADDKTANEIEYDDIFRNISGGNIYLSYLNREDEKSLLSVYRFDKENAVHSKLYDAEVTFPLSSIAVAKDEVLYALGRNSAVYRFDGGEWTRVFTPKNGYAAASMTAGDDGALYLFLTSQSGVTVMALAEGESFFRPARIDADGFIKLNVYDETGWVALDKGYNCVVSKDGGQSVISGLTVSPTVLWDTNAIYALGAFSVVTAAALLVIRRVWLKRRLHLLPKLLLATFLIFAVGMAFLVWAAERLVKERTEDSIRESLLEYADMAAKTVDGGRLAAIDSHDPFDDEYYIALSAQMEELSEYRLLTMSENGVEKAHGAFTSFWLYKVDGGRFYSLACGHFVAGLEAAYLENNAAKAEAAREELLRERKPTSTYADGIESELRWLAVLQPIFDGDEIVGYLEVSRPLAEVGEAVKSTLANIVRVGLIMFAVVMAAITIILALSTKTLGRLKRGALAVSGGDYSARVSSRSWDETGEIAEAFNKMASSVESSVNDITAVSRGYSRFVSDKMLELLGKGSIKEIRAGDNVTLTAAQIMLFTDSFDSLRGKAFFDALGRFYDAVIPCVTAGGGLVSDYSPGGFAAMFEGSPDGVIRTACDMYKALDNTGDKTACHVFLNYGRVLLGVTGNGESLNMLTASGLRYEAYAVGMMGKRLGARLLVPQSALDAMTENAYRRRFIGFLHMNGEPQTLHDFFDCDTPEIRLKKDETKERFERGVRLYYEKEYAAARGVFVDIIKVFPEDMAAREYLRLSHKGREAGSEPVPLLEL